MIGLEDECQRLAEAIARGGQLDSLVRALEERNQRLQQARAELGRLTAVCAPGRSLAVTERRLRTLLADWRGLLTRDVTSGREVLRTLLVGPLRFTPVVDDRRRGYAFEGAVALDRVIAGTVDLPTKVASPPGTGILFDVPLRGTTRRRAA